MKRFLFTILCLLHGGLLSAQNVSFDQLATWTPEQLDKAITESTGGQRGLDLLNKVVETKRLDLLAVCFGHQLTKYFTIRAVTKMPEGEHRHRAVITMFRTPSSFWPREEEEGIVLGRSMLDPDYLLIEPFTSTMSKLLPGVKFDVPLIRYQADRERLADQLEAALNANNPPPAQLERPAVEAVPTKNVTPQPPPQPSAIAKPSSLEESPKVNHGPPWIMLGGTVAVLLALLTLQARLRR